MSQVQTIFKNMSWLLISQIIASICGFIWTILMARYLGVSNYGIFGFATSFTGILAITVDLGINTQVVRHISTDYDSAPKYLGNAIPLKSIFSIGCMILTLVILILMKSDELVITVTLLFTIEMIIKSYIGLLNGSFQAFEEGKYQGIGNTIVTLLTLIFILISIFGDLGLIGIAISYIIANFVALLYEYYVLNKHIVKPKFELDRTFCKSITLISIPFAITGLLYTIYYSIDVVMLTNMVGSYATGIYNATYKLIAVLNLFYSVYIAVIFPVMSKFFKNDESMLLISFEKSIKYLMLIIIPLAVGTVFYSTDIINLIYGNKYDAASSVLSILIWTVCLLFISGAANTLLNASHKEVTVTKIYAIAAVFNIVLNFFMIPYLSYNGAAITTVLSDVLIVIMQAYAIYKLGHRPNKKLYSDLIKIIIGSGILGIALYMLNLNMWVAIPVGIIIYFAVVYLLRLFDDSDKYIINEILGKN
ncbi:polysaccharide biosynthesis protein [Methanobrevibacter sp. YE315]|uniref:flippase n=1 Tax=Methanobrevibacter sp. YE315 TaxID=1609968 RepID=UPI000764D684|nr:flippase [Methanobrevibacter sp. YE315]AMD17764.1 polysaccharide biosynthesis protein [Methanobrevibacter sp. YE315]